MISSRLTVHVMHFPSSAKEIADLRIELQEKVQMEELEKKTWDVQAAKSVEVQSVCVLRQTSRKWQWCIKAVKIAGFNK